jgi:hypothetical protein
VLAYQKRGLFLSLGMEIGYAVTTLPSGGSEETASGFDALYYHGCKNAWTKQRLRSY